MGNAKSNVTSGVKAQASGASTFGLYKYLDLSGGGELIDLMKQATRSKDYTELDNKITDGLLPFLYNEGRGKIVHIREIVRFRCAATGNTLSKDPGPSDDKMLDFESMSEKKIREILLEPGTQYKELCWKMEEAGAVGETALHVCLLNATSMHADLAKRLLKIYPKLINDIYMSDEYFGENILHMGIVAEDPAMVKFLLDCGADYHQRSCGNFFCSDDQKTKRKDSLEHEWFDLPVETNYIGHTYWGDFPLGFAACLGQEECVRLLIARKADCNLQDANGNTVLHMLVVHDLKMRERNEASANYTHPEEMFDLLAQLGAKLHIFNNQNLTPLTLAAKLGRIEIFAHILELEREEYWRYGNVTCAAYPLTHIDTIAESGEINTNSALYYLVFGDLPEHLDMISGVVSNLLVQKWETFAKFRFLRRFAFFSLYFAIFLVTFYLRPGTDTRPEERTVGNRTQRIKDPCYLLRTETGEEKARIALEVIVLSGATVYLFLSLKEVYHQGYRIFFQTLRASPAKALFLMANIFVILIVPGRAACAVNYDDVVSVLAILCTAPYFLFFCRGFKLVGPFVVMIYTMIKTDLIRFFVIYLVFVVGFSQGLYVLFRGTNNRVYDHPIESMVGMFIMSLGEFSDIYESFSRISISIVPQIIFLVYMVLVTLLLVNMLIAMMGNTYQIVAEQQGEWLRQWAKIILVVEQTVTTAERRIQQKIYTEPMNDGRRAIVIKWHQSEKEIEANAEQKEEEDLKMRNILQKKAEDRLRANQAQSGRTP